MLRNSRDCDLLKKSRTVQANTGKAFISRSALAWTYSRVEPGTPYVLRVSSEKTGSARMAEIRGTKKSGTLVTAPSYLLFKINWLVMLRFEPRPLRQIKKPA
jgi:hypothetical protein